MKRYIVLTAMLIIAGCGGDDRDFEDAGSTGANQETVCVIGQSKLGNCKLAP
jgi:hypothetical protein